MNVDLVQQCICDFYGETITGMILCIQQQLVAASGSFVLSDEYYTLPEPSKSSASTHRPFPTSLGEQKCNAVFDENVSSFVSKSQSTSSKHPCCVETQEVANENKRLSVFLVQILQVLQEQEMAILPIIKFVEEHLKTEEAGRVLERFREKLSDLETTAVQLKALVYNYGEKADVFINNSPSKSFQVQDSSREHLEAFSTDGTGKHIKDSSCLDQCSFEMQTMLTTPSYTTKSPRQNEFIYETVSEFGDLEYSERIFIPSEELCCSTAEDPGVTKTVVKAESSEYWKELVERMGSNVNDMAIILEFEDSFPADNGEDAGNQNLPENSDQSLYLEHNDEVPLPPLPLSLPPYVIQRDAGIHDFYE